ncbi:prominin-1-like isoform X2 [Symsagittifera roscoffensis]|uniref:prominin-1-like isoform X2 n=1 Tax=Symsagittifera roscoffensis TaxID=84072 RepID=UPI00307B55EF
MLSASNRQIMSCRSGMSLASLVYLATSVILFSASTVQSCDVSTTVCLVNGSISFPPASGTPSNVLVDTEPDFGLAMSIYLEEIVKGFFKFVFPAGLPWDGIGAMAQTFLGTDSNETLLADPSLADKKGDPSYILEETQTLLSDNYSSYIVFTVIVTLSLLFVFCCPLVSCCFCICRCCCNKCGAQKRQKNPTTVCCVVLLVGTILGMVLAGLGGAMLTATNNQITEDIPDKAFEFPQDSIQTIGDWVNNVISDMFDTGTLMFSNVTDIIIADMQEAGDQIFQPIIDWLEDSLASEFAAVDTAMADYSNYSGIMDSLYDDIYYGRSTQPENMKEISNALAAISAALGGDATCMGDAPCSNVIAEIDKHIIDDSTYTGAYTETPVSGPSIASGFNSSLLLQDALTRAGDTLNNLTESQLDALEQMMKTTISNLTDVLDEARDGITDTINKSLSTLTDSLDDIREDSAEYDDYRKGVGAIPMAPAALVFFTVLLGLILGGAGFKKHTEPHERSSLSNGGGKCICLGSVCSFLFVWFYMIGFIFPLLIFSTPLMICQGLQSNEIIENIIDRPYFLDGENEYYLAKLILGNSSIELSIATVMSDCKSGKTAWTAFHVNESTLYDYNSFLNSSKLIDDAMSQFNDSSNFNFSEFEFIDGDFQSDIDDIQANEASYKTALDSFKTFVQSTVGVYYTQLNTNQAATPTGVTGTPCEDSATACDSLDTILTSLQAVVPTSSAITQAETDLIAVIASRDQMKTDQTDFEAAVDASKTAIGDIATTTAALEVAVDNAQTALQTNGTDWILNNTEQYALKLFGWFDDTFAYILNAFANDIGECESFVKIYDAFLVYMCDYFLLELSGLFFASGVAAVGLITLMVFATKLSKYFKRMDLPEGVVGEPNEFEAAYTADNSKTLENPPERRVYTPKQTPERAYTPIQRPTKRVVPVITEAAPAPVAASAPPPPAYAAPQPRPNFGYVWDAKKDWEP